MHGKGTKVAGLGALAEGVWPHVHEVRAKGAFSLQEIADALNAAGVAAFKGGRWSSMQVWRLVREGSGGVEAARR